MIGWGLVVCGLALIVSAFLFIRFAKLPPWTHRDVLAFLALLGTIGGAMILTLLKWLQTDKFNEQADRLISELVRERPSQLSDAVGGTLTTIIETASWDQKLTSAGIIIVLLSLGLVISARTLKGKIFGNEFEMGSGEQRAAAEAARETANAADTVATKIEQAPAPAAAPPAAPPMTPPKPGAPE